MKNNKPLTPKQRERLAREARQKNAAKAAAAAAVKEKLPVPRETKWFVALLAMLLVFATLASVMFGFLVVEWTENPYATVYETVRMKDYLDTSKMGKKFYTGLDVDVSTAYATFLEKTGKLEETLEENLRLLLLANRKEIALGQKNTAIGYGDDVSYYIIGVKDKNGKAVLTTDFAASSYTASTLTVGNAAFGADFDEKLMGMKPSETLLVTDTTGVLAGDEVVIITLYAYKGTKKADANDPDETKNYTWSASPDEVRESARLVLSEQSEALREALKGQAVGEDITFLLKDYKLKDDSTSASDAVKFDVRVHAVVEETAKEITFRVPDDYFAEGDTQDLYLLNGTELTFSVILSYMNDYEVPELDAAFVTETMKFETDETDVVAAFKEAKRAELSEKYETERDDQYIQLVFQALASKANFVTVDMPTEALNELYSEMIDYFTEVVGAAPQSEDELNAFAQQYYGAQSYYDVLTANAKGNLIVFYIFRNAKMKISDDEMEKAYREYVDGLIEEAGDEELYNEDHFILLYTKEGLYRKARTQLVQDMVGEYLLAHNNLITEKAE